MLVNGQQVYQNMEYQLSTYLHTLLYTPGSKKDTTLASALYYLDRPGRYTTECSKIYFFTNNITGEFDFQTEENNRVDLIREVEYPALYNRAIRSDFLMQ